MNETLKCILARRSCKDYKPDAVPGEALDAIIEAGVFAASGMNMQSPVIVAVTDRETRDLVSRLNSLYDRGHRPDPFYGAPVILVVLAKADVPTAVYDGSLVLGNMMLAATSLGLGNCWIHRAKEVFASEEGRALLSKWGLDADGYVGVGNLAVGYAASEPKPRPPRREGRVIRW